MNQEHAQVKRRQPSSAQFSELLAQCLTSGLTQTELCRRHGLDLRMPKRRPEGRPRFAARSACATNWVAIELRPSSDAKPGPPPGGFSRSVGSCRIELAGGFDGESLRRSLAGLAGR